MNKIKQLVNNIKDKFWYDFWTGSQSNCAEISRPNRIKDDWYQNGIIWLNLESLHMDKESNQISSKLQDPICFATLIHSSIYNDQVQSIKEGLAVVKEQEQTQKSWQKVGLSFHSTGPFKVIWGQQSHPGRALKLSQSFARLGASKDMSYNSYGLPTFQNWLL